jgi:hypothetical protein
MQVESFDGGTRKRFSIYHLTFIICHCLRLGAIRSLPHFSFPDLRHIPSFFSYVLLNSLSRLSEMTNEKCQMINGKWFS